MEIGIFQLKIRFLKSLRQAARGLGRVLLVVTALYLVYTGFQRDILCDNLHMVELVPEFDRIQTMPWHLYQGVGSITTVMMSTQLGLCQKRPPSFAAALIALENDDYQKAVTEFTQSPHSDLRFLGIGIAYYRAGYEQQAIDTFSQLSAADYFGMLGRTLLTKGKAEEALPYLELSNRINPTVNRWLDLAEAHANLRDYTAEGRALDQAILINDADYELRRRRIMLEFKLESEPASVLQQLLDLLKEIKSAPTTDYVQLYRLYWALADVTLAMNDPRAAIDWLGLAVEVPSVQDDLALARRCRLYLQLDEVMNAWDCQHILEQSATSKALPFAVAADIYAHEEQWESAIALLEQSMEYVSQPSVGEYIQLARWATKAGYIAQEQEYWRAVLRFDPTNYEALKQLGQR